MNVYEITHNNPTYGGGVAVVAANNEKEAISTLKKIINTLNSVKTTIKTQKNEFSPFIPRLICSKMYQRPHYIITR